MKEIMFFLTAKFLGISLIELQVSVLLISLLFPDVLLWHVLLFVGLQPIAEAASDEALWIQTLEVCHLQSSGLHQVKDESTHYRQTSPQVQHDIYNISYRVCCLFRYIKNYECTCVNIDCYCYFRQVWMLLVNHFKKN